MRILVTGATGVIGPGTVQALASAGHAVSVFARAALPPDLAALTSTMHIGKLDARGGLARAVRGVDAIVHLAALLHSHAGDGRTDADYHRVNVQGTASVLDAAEDAGIGRVLLASTIAVYGDDRTGVITETSPVYPETAYARTKLAAEQLVLAFGARGGSPVVLRIGAVYGPRMKGAYPSLVAALRLGRFVPPGAGRNRRSLIHEDDVAMAILTATTHAAAPGRVFNVADPAPYTMRQIVRAICQAIGRREPTVYLPRPLAIGAAAAIETASRLIGRRPPITRSMVRKYNQEIAVDASEIERSLGFRSRLSLESGWRQTIRDMAAR